MEAVRRILNVSSELPWEETVSHLNRFAWTMKLSGYNEYDRYHAISGAIRRVSAMKEEVKSGVRVSLFRSRQQIVESKRNKKDWTNTWFLKGNTVGTISCPVTPGGVLRKTLNRQINRDRDSNLLVIEDGGCPIYNGLRVRDPSRSNGCIFGDPLCIVDPSVQCDRTGIVYKIVCIACKSIVETDSTENSNSYESETHNYVGMSRTSLHNRMLAHLKGQRRRDMGNPLYRHDFDVHDGAKQRYVTTVLATEAKIVRLCCKSKGSQ